MTCTSTNTGTREAGLVAAGASPVGVAPLQRIEHGLDAALEQLEAVAVTIADGGELPGVVPLERVALEARVGRLKTELQAVRMSLGTLVGRELVLSPA